jgi:hypothetical protein
MKAEALGGVSLGHRTGSCGEGLKEEPLGPFRVSSFRKIGSRGELTCRSPELLKHERRIV